MLEQPALSPEEWANRSADRGDEHVHLQGAHELVIWDRNHEGVWEPGTATEETCHAVAALALHRQPYGFTWDDVDDIRGFCATYEHEWGPAGEWGNYPTKALRATADRIAALLPPRDNR